MNQDAFGSAWYLLRGALSAARWVKGPGSQLRAANGTAEAYQDFRGGVKLQAASAVRATVAKALRIGKAACHANNFTAILAFAVSLVFTLSSSIVKTDLKIRSPTRQAL
jgi:hypothetical protein